MTQLIGIFINNLLPILLVALVGYWAGKYLEIEPRSISRIVFHIFSPFLLFDLLVNSALSGSDSLRVVFFTLLYIAVTGLIAYILGKVFKLERRLLTALLITTITINAGNYGLSLNLFAFGEQALAYAGIFFVASAIITYTAGVTIASMGKYSFTQSLKGLVKIPVIYAVLLAMLFIAFDWNLPVPLARSTKLLADAAIPGMLLVLGLQLQRNVRIQNLKALGLVIGIRLVASPILALGLAALVGLQGSAYKAGVTEASMPTAVLSTILATEYDASPTFVTTAVLVTTLLSPLSLTPLLAYLGV